MSPSSVEFEVLRNHYGLQLPSFTYLWGSGGPPPRECPVGIFFFDHGVAFTFPPVATEDCLSTARRLTVPISRRPLGLTR